VTLTLASFAERKLDVELLARQTVRVDARLQVAGGQERVEVVGASPVIQTERATIDSSKSGDEISRLALNFRATNNTSPIVVATLARRSAGSQRQRRARAWRAITAGSLVVGYAGYYVCRSNLSVAAPSDTRRTQVGVVTIDDKEHADAY